MQELVEAEIRTLEVNISIDWNTVLGDYKDKSLDKREDCNFPVNYFSRCNIVNTV